ncbi:MAG: hypothetical protein JXA95_11935 [Spirochaetales bacterium]|nr:hypothetical protein [Spirochaetales bacterium]
MDPAGKVIDQIGVLGEDPGSAWDAAGVTGATGEHTLVRKRAVVKGNQGDWILSAGTSEADSEWIVYGQNYWDNLGILSEE